MVRLSSLLVAGLSVVPGRVLGALEVDFESLGMFAYSIKAAAKLKVEDLLAVYRGDEPGMIPGILPGPPPADDYYWWIGGALWGTLMDYRYLTKDTAYDATIMQAMTWQVGELKDYMPSNWSASMGNDDQAFWALAALTAAETGFADPPEEMKLDWLALAQAVFNEQTNKDRRINYGNCNGLLRWQAINLNNGWDYINTIPNTCYFNIGARLARYFDNSTLADKVGETWDLLVGVKYIDDEGNVYDGAHEGDDCTVINRAQFSYNPALLIQGLAHLYNMSDGDQKWGSKLDHILPRTLEFFFPNGTAYEWSCEREGSCTTDMLSFKGFLHRWLANTAYLAPKYADKIMPLLKSSAKSAVSQCTAGANGRACGFRWTSGVYDGKTGACQDMSVLGALLSLLPTPGTGVLTSNSGGTSKGDPNAGSDLSEHIPALPSITTGDRAGAGIITLIVLAAGLGVYSWIGL
ncbi:uncharacterized protein JN550_008550 [Neoarthrinium moseri]|uniref:uncharacterized protein n=1 Tax=Neoarthrinium moseri TaxID=1658444 RepID=UPI001FDB725F|nr:uncharacterized protein JN550_008550 [Neoarthrinium moseri]KAI1865004.1 hypothetical protein JN550_008550 [Neoarthrinium moseri]